VEIVNIRAVAIGKLNSPLLPKSEPGSTDASKAIIVSDHKAYFDGEMKTTPIYDRSLLRPNNEIVGPAIITQKDSTTLIIPGHIATVDEHMNILIKGVEA
jgi:N-methylhydantoinase A